MMTDYTNPNEMWRHNGYDPYKGMNDDERLMAGCFQAAVFIVMIIVGLALCALMGSCTTTKFIPVESQHTEHHWHTDSVRERDSTHTERNTVIRELDSAAMARYGIQMERNQRAWLVLQREMENRLRELEHMTAQQDTVHDSIPYPVEVTKEVPARLTWWQQTRIHVGGIAIWILVLFIIYLLLKKKIAWL